MKFNLAPITWVTPFLIKLLLPLLEQTTNEPNSDVRIINLRSSAHSQGPKEGFLLSEVKSPMASTSIWVRYGQSKLANVHFTRQLAKLYPRIKSVAVHPGSNVGTNISSSLKQPYKFLIPFIFI